MADEGSTVVVDRHESALPFGRIVLALAATIAIVAIGIAIWKQREPAPAPPSGQATTQQPDVGSAIAGLEAKLRDNPRDTEGWRRLGWAYYMQQRFGDAANAYRKASQLDATSADTWSALGEALTLAVPADQPAAVPAEAEAAFRRAIAIDATDPRARYFLAVKKDLAGDHRGAIDDWIKLLRESPPGAPWVLAVRDTVTQSAQKNKIDIAGRLPPPPPAAGQAPTEAAMGGAQIATSGIPGPTQEQMRAASSMPPGQQDAMVQGMVESLANRLRTNPKDADGWIRLMRARMVLNQPQQAAQALRDGLAAFPGDQAARDRLTEGARTLGVPAG